MHKCKPKVFYKCKPNDKSINAFINRLNRKINTKTFDENYFLAFNKTMKRKPVIPEVIDDIELLYEIRNKTYTSLDENGIKKKELSKALDDMVFYRETMVAIRRPKEKKNKYGNVGMDDLIKIVAKSNQDIKQIKDAQSIVSANEWIERHGFNDLYKARGKDLDGDGKPEVVVQTKTCKNLLS